MPPLFFVGWVNDDRPKYEWQESIRVVGVNYIAGDDTYCEEDTILNYVDIATSTENDFIEKGLECDYIFRATNDGAITLYENWNYYVCKKVITEKRKYCYTKEKVRIN